MTNIYTAITGVKDGVLTLIRVLDGAYGVAGAPLPDSDVDVFAHLFRAETLEDAERIAKDLFTPAGGSGVEEKVEEPPC